MDSYLIFVAMGIGAITGLAVATWLVPRMIRRFENWQRYQAILAVFLLVCFTPMVYSNLKQGEGYWTVLILIAFAAMLAGALRPKRDRDSEMDFVYDPSRCGRCGYDLRASDGPTCPECGWAMPVDIARIERRDWAMWWRGGWRIGYLKNWKKTLVMSIGNALAFVALTVWCVWMVSPPAAAIGGAMTVLTGINVVRVLQYGRRLHHDDSNM